MHVSADTPHWRVNLLLAAVIAALTILHLLETLVWAAPLYALKMIPSIRDAYYYVLENYTTLGAGARHPAEGMAPPRPDHRDVRTLHIRLDDRRSGEHDDRVRPTRQRAVEARQGSLSIEGVRPKTRFGLEEIFGPRDT